VLLLSDVLAAKGDLYNARAALEALLDNYSEDEALVNEARQKLQRLEQQIQQNSRLNLQPDTSKMQFTEENQNQQGN
jgi:exonuclease VII small subunit